MEISVYKSKKPEDLSKIIKSYEEDYFNWNQVPITINGKWDYERNFPAVVRGHRIKNDLGQMQYLVFINLKKHNYTACFVDVPNDEWTMYTKITKTEALEILEKHKDSITPDEYVEIKDFLTHQPICSFCGRTLSEVIYQDGGQIVLSRVGYGICTKCTDIASIIQEKVLEDRCIYHSNWGNEAIVKYID